MPEQQFLERILISEEQLAARVHELGRQISADYRGKQPFFLGVLKGCFVFMSDVLCCSFPFSFIS